MATAMKTIAIVLNPEKPDAIELVKTLVPHLHERGSASSSSPMRRR